MAQSSEALVGRQAHRASSKVRVGASSATLIGIGFLCSYMALHALHVAHRDPAWVRSLSAIPLFAVCEAAALTSLLFGPVVSFFVLDREELVARLPVALAISAALFALEIIVLP